MTYDESEAHTREHLDRAAKEIGVTWKEIGFIKGYRTTFDALEATWGDRPITTRKVIDLAPCITVAITYGPDTFGLGAASTAMIPTHWRSIGRGRNPNEGIIKQFCDAFERVI